MWLGGSSVSRSRFEVLPDDLWVPRSDPEQGKRRSLGLTASLLPVPKRVHADSDGLREPNLGEANEPPQSRDVIAGLELPRHETPAHAGWDGSSKLFGSELGDVRHLPCSALRRRSQGSRRPPRTARLLPRTRRHAWPGLRGSWSHPKRPSPSKCTPLAEYVNGGLRHLRGVQRRRCPPLWSFVRDG